jgi:hypothetical protein
MNKPAILDRIMVARQELNDAEVEVGKVLAVPWGSHACFD